MQRTALFTAALLLCGSHAAAQSFRTIDGSSNNLNFPTMGQAGIGLLRSSAPQYGDGLSTPSGASRPSARAVSNALSSQTGVLPNGKNASDYIWQWGQFVDHDIDLTPGASPGESFDIDVPAGDPFFDPGGTGTVTIPLGRSTWIQGGSGVRHQTNEITAWIDGSNLYGSDQARSLELRTNDGTGRLATSPHATGDLLPFNLNGFPNAPDDNDTSMFLAGDLRANEQSALTAMHTLWMREHNWLCDALANMYAGLPGELYYQVARAIVIGEMQQVTYEEYLPALLGPGGIPAYVGYDNAVTGSIGNEFSTAAYRFGHSMLSPTLLRLDSAGDVVSNGNLPLMDAFFNPDNIISGGGLDPLLRGMASQVCSDSDLYVVDDVRNFLFGMPGSGGFDLISLNIQRGRDHGLPDYNTVRVSYGLAPKATFAEISSDPAIVAGLTSTYATVNDIDPWVGAQAEDHVPGALVGELVQASLSDQFTRLRDGDRYYWEGYLPQFFKSWINIQNLATVIRRNTGIGAELQDDVFHVPIGG
ncbi:MAG: peroxidase [Planctomycetota bacterium]|jgi:peroxidase